MAVNLTGTWTNSNGKDRDIVEIISIPGGIFIHNHNHKPGQDFENEGIAKLPSGTCYANIGDKFNVIWSDTSNSKGQEKGIRHCTTLILVSMNLLEQVADQILTPGITKSKHKTSYGNWRRSTNQGTDVL